MRKGIPLLLVFTLLLSAACSSAPPAAYPAAYSAVTGSPLSPDGLTADRGAFTLCIDPETVSFEIRGAGGAVYKSLPERYDDPEWVDEILSKNLASVMTVTFLDAGYAAQVVPCSGNTTVTYERIPDGLRMLFRFDRQRVTVPLDLTLNADGFAASVAPGDIKEDGDFLVNQIMLLPYFLSGTAGDDGFVFYPDGSGAVSGYQKDYNNTPDITQPVYGFDRGVGAIEVISQAQGYRMPVFGAKTNGVGYLAVIEGPAAFISSIQTGVSRTNNRYFKNAAIFTYRDVGKVYLRDSQTTVNTSYTIPAPVTATAPLTVRYILLDGDDVGYPDMAAAYRGYLEEQGVFTQTVSQSNNVHLTLTGALVKPSSFLGIPMEREITLTTFSQAGEILDSLHGAGIGSAAVLYTGAQSGGYNSRWTRDFKFNGALGGKKDFDVLTARYPNDTVFLNGELMQVYKEGAGFSASRDAARTTGNGINFQYPYFLLDGTRDAGSRRWYLLAPSLWMEAMDGFAYGKWRSDFNGGLALEDAGALVYSEYEQKAPLYRDVTGPMLTDSLSRLASLTPHLALTYGNAYTWGIADHLFSVPLGASAYFIQQEEIPFYQLVSHGYIEYSGEPQNLHPDKQMSFLRSVEYGAVPHYSGIYAPSSELTRSVLAGLFSACYKDWLPDAKNQAAQALDLYERIAGQRMIGHEKLSDGIYQTVYENGVIVTVDYNTMSFMKSF